MKKQAGIIIFSIFVIFVVGLLVSCDNPKAIPFELTEGGRIVVKANVNVTSGRYFWDTGMSISQVNCRVDNLVFIYKGDFLIKALLPTVIRDKIKDEYVTVLGCVHIKEKRPRSR